MNDTFNQTKLIDMDRKDAYNKRRFFQEECYLVPTLKKYQIKPPPPSWRKLMISSVSSQVNSTADKTRQKFVFVMKLQLIDIK
jgi:hypothetical protein